MPRQYPQQHWDVALDEADSTSASVIHVPGSEGSSAGSRTPEPESWYQPHRISSGHRASTVDRSLPISVTCEVPPSTLSGTATRQEAVDRVPETSLGDINDLEPLDLEDALEADAAAASRAQREAEDFEATRQ